MIKNIIMKNLFLKIKMECPLCNSKNLGETEIANSWNREITTINQCFNCGAMFGDEK